MDYFDLAARHVDDYIESHEDSNELSGLTYDDMPESYRSMLRGVVLSVVKFINMTPGAADGLGIENVSSLNL